ncbi:MAG: VanZ family protein [Eubacteriales bacterium]|nr:VanZ family protein [Eubacteriales bacterium]
MKQRQKRWTILIIVTLCFIWGNSLMPPAVSNAISDKITQLLSGGVLPAEMEANSWLPSFLIRKTAHFTEFALLGISLAGACRARNMSKREAVLLTALCGVLAALVDETIQLFNGRTSSVKDVWLDSFGLAAGCCLTYFLFRHIVKKQEHKAG